MKHFGQSRFATCSSMVLSLPEAACVCDRAGNQSQCARHVEIAKLATKISALNGVRAMHHSRLRAAVPGASGNVAAAGGRAQPSARPVHQRADRLWQDAGVCAAGVVRAPWVRFVQFLEGVQLTVLQSVMGVAFVDSVLSVAKQCEDA